MKPRAKVLLIGVDSGDRELIVRWAAEGALPTFRRLIERAAWGSTLNPAGLEAGSVWATFYTGVSPARHGQYAGNEHFDRHAYQEIDYRPDELAMPPVWEMLSRAGRRVAVIDAPYTYLHPHINGINVVDWATHARRRGATFHTWPPSLASEILERFGPDEIGECDAVRPRDAAEHKAFRDKLVERICRKTALSAHLLEQGGWDLFMTVYGDPHCTGHQQWHLHATDHCLYDPALAAEVGDPVKDVYVALDAGIGRLLELTGPETTTIVYCSHGMTHQYSGSRLLDDMLLALEGGHRSGTRDVLAGTVREAWVNAPHWLRAALRPLRGPARNALVVNRREGRRFFEVVNNNATGGVRINLRGREAQGVVEPSEFEGLCRRLADELRAFVNIETGDSVVTEVIRTAERHQGERLDDLPDLLVRWNRAAPIRTVTSPSTGVINHRHIDGRTGDHTPDGAFFVLGPGAMHVNRKVPAADFAPTLLSLLGVATPGLDGRPIPEIFRQPARVA